MHGDLNGRPKAAVAFKFPHDSKATTLRNIVWQVGKSGRITPVAEFDTVNLAGVMVERASLHTARNVQNLQLFKGCRVLVSRRNDCIPYLEANLDAVG
jgi:DNA ligase (NAD+)